MINEKILKELNKQITAEFYSAYLYLSMASDFEKKGLPGSSKWMKAQAQEEITHAMKLFDYVVSKQEKVDLMAIDKPELTWESPLAIFEAAYNHEVKVTTLIHNLVKIADEENDQQTKDVLQWFVDEQVEEEASADSVVQKLKLIKDEEGLHLLDQELGLRGFQSMPTT